MRSPEPAGISIDVNRGGDSQQSPETPIRESPSKARVRTPRPEPITDHDHDARNTSSSTRLCGFDWTHGAEGERSGADATARNVSKLGRYRHDSGVGA